MAPSKVPPGLGKSQKDAVGLEILIQQSDANTGDNAGVVPVAAKMDGGRTRRKRRKTRRKRRKTKRKTRRKKRKTKRKTRRKKRKTKRKRRKTKRKTKRKR